MQRALTSVFFSTLPLATFGCLIPLAAIAQITPDGTTSTTVNQAGIDFTIDQGDRVGDNLFHSFNEFSVPTLGWALFNNASDIANIFSRVTGSNISNIDGLLSANGAANLFLINPNGIIFGPNARLDLGGSFFASSAESLLFEDNVEFSASNPTAAPLLTVSVPIGANFRGNPGDIVNRANVDGLEVAPGQNLTLVGGDINFEAGNATARGGNIELGGLSEGGIVTFNDDGSLNFPEDVVQADITITDSFLYNEALGEGDGGNIIIDVTNGGTFKLSNGIVSTRAFGEGNAGDLNITAGSVFLTNGGQVAASTFGQGNSGSVKITATDTITFDGEDSDGFVSGAFNNVRTNAVGDAGGVIITTGSLNLTNGGQVDVSTSGQGNAGAVEITASHTITIDGEDSVGLVSGATSQVTPGAVGNAGGVTITTGSLTLSNGGRVDASTFGQGNAGSVTITASDTITIDGENSGDLVSGAISQVSSEAVGDAGGVTITTGSLNLTNGGQVDASTFGQGNAGAVAITASDNITIDGESLSGNSSGAASQVAQEADGNAGGVNITTDSLTLTNGGRVDATTFGQGKAGDVTVNARESITINGVAEKTASGLFANALIGNGNGGDIEVSTKQLTLDDRGTIKAGNFDSLNVLSSGTGEPGNIEINANSISLSNQASINTNIQSETGNGANIILQLTGDLILRNNSLISARALGTAKGGNITIDAESIIAFPSQPPENGNDIIADAALGRGGKIEITAESLFGIEERPAIPRNGTNDIDASPSSKLRNMANLDTTGDISLNTNLNSDPSDLIELPEDVLDATNQIAQNACEQGVGSEFIVTGKGGLRPNPHGTLSNDSVQVALVEPIPSQQENRESKSLETTTPDAVPAQGWIFTDTGEVMLTSYVPSAMAEAIPATPLVQTKTNPAQLANQAEKLYQNQEFDEAANRWSQAAQAFAASGDNLNQAMAWSNLALTYQQLGKWENINQAIQNSLISLNSAPENNRLVAQTLDIQGKLQRETGQTAAAIDTWQKAANIYQKLGESAALTQNNLNQAQAFQDLGLYSLACQTILVSLKLENIATCQDLDRLTTEELEIKLDKITAQPSLQKVWGLGKLGDLLLLIGQPQKSRQVLETSLTLAKKLNSPSEIAATYLSIGKNYHAFTTKEAEPIRNKRRENQQQALKAYRQAITSSPNLITQQQAKLNQFSLLLQLQQWSEPSSLGQEIITQIANLPPNRSNIYAQINFAHSLIELLDRDITQPPPESKLPSLNEIDRILTTATENARTLGDQRIEAYAWGDRGRLYELTDQLLPAEQSTQQALSLISTLESPDIAYQYLWQLGRIQNRQGDLEKAIAAYTKAYNALQPIRADLATINPEVRFSFRDRVEPVYRELVALNFQYAQTLGNKANTKDEQEIITAKLIQARDVMESLQLAQLQNFFRQACIVANPQQIDQIDHNAAVIYTIVLPDKLGILLSLPNQPPKLYSVEVTQAEISAAVETMRNSLKTSSIPVAETLPEYQKIYDWLIRPLEAELEKNKVETLAFVLDDDLRNLPMAVLHDGQQYLVEKYALALTSGLQLLDPKPLTTIEVNAIAAGLSKNPDGSDLPGIAAELQAMQEMGLTDDYLLNQEFTKQALEKNIVDSNSPILHLATLAQFSAKAEDTFILAWDDRINIKEFADLLRVSTFKRRNAIELLVLSAGETASGDSRANLGLAGVALQAGVRSTLATVWPVVDKSTAKVMKRFYFELKEASKTQVNKAEALRQAQLSLIKDQKFNHPHYWAPFILIGNWQ